MHATDQKSSQLLEQEVIIEIHFFFLSLKKREEPGLFTGTHLYASINPRHEENKDEI